MERSRHLLKSSVLVFLLFSLGKLTGVIRVRLISNEFGTSPAFDAFTAANQLPEVFVTLISGGALAAAFIPVYSQYLTSKRSQESVQLANTILTLVILVLAGLSLIGIIFAPAISARFLAPRVSGELQQLTATLMRIILLQTTLFGISGVLSSILNAHQHFALPALAPVALDIGYLTGLFVLVPGMGISGLAWGTVLGGLLHIAIQTPALIRYGFRYFPGLKLRLPGVREVLYLMFPRIIMLGSVQIVDLVIIFLTSGVTGNQSGYFYAYNLMQLPETLLGTAIAIVAFPTMAELYNAGDLDGLRRNSMTFLRIIWTLTIPAAVGVVLLGKPLIQLFLGGGAFDTQSVDLVYSVLVFFSLRIVSEASIEILARLFYAQHNTYTPMYVALGWLALSISLAFPLHDALGIRGLALASTIAFSAQAIVLFFLNRRKLGQLREKELALSAGRAIVGATCMAFTIWALRQAIHNDLLFLAIAGSAGVSIYFFSAYVVGGREIPALIQLVRSRSEEKSPTVL